MISLASNTIDNKDMDALAEWIKTYPRLTKGPLTKEFEEGFAKAVGRKHAVYVNSGSSANLLMAYIYKIGFTDKLAQKVVIPAVAWSTSIAPFIQLGIEPILCDVDMDTLCLSTDHLEAIIEQHNPQALLMVNVLGFMGNVKEIQKICEANNMMLLEDSCETLGSEYIGGGQAGTFGVMSTFSFYFGHHISTIEGGMITTNDDGIYNGLLMTRSHGWARDLDDTGKEYWSRIPPKVNDFKRLYTFYEPGFNLRSTDLQAFIGLRQLKKVDDVCGCRAINFNLYQDLLVNDYWKPNPKYNKIVSNMGYPVIHPKIDEIVKALQEGDVECRPLVCGSLARQPFVTRYCDRSTHRVYLPNADICDKHGLYVPNHVALSAADITYITWIINKVIA
jgi:CDP-6-deoxy-D-xylo-4-hexulose-3-dehydrase